MKNLNEYTVTIFSENKTGILGRIIGLITRRHINIESITASPSSIENIYRYTIVVLLSKSNVQKLVAQIDKQVEVLKAFYYSNDEVIYQEIALYKVPTNAFHNGDELESLIRRHNARILTVENEYIVIEKTGHQNETESLLHDLKDVGIYEFVRSGRVAIVKPLEMLNNYLTKLELSNKNI